MDQLPVELRTQIFSQACFDDKATGYALCLTSKAIKETSDRVRFEAISLYGLAQISGFAAMLHFVSPRCVRLKHLFVSGDSLEEETKARVKRAAYGRPREDFIYESDDESSTTEDWKEAATKRKETQQTIDEAFSTILSHTGLTLVTLFVKSMLESTSILSSPHPLPKLTDLCVISTEGLFELQKCFPNLRRIHTTSPLHDWDTTHQIDFTKNAPALEELRLSDLDSSAEWFVIALRCHARAPDSKQDRKDQLVLPTTMRRVILQQCAPPYDARCGNPWIDHKEFRGALRDVAALFRESTVAKFEVLRLRELGKELLASGRSSGLGYFFDDARRDWTDAISGTGKGCWDDQDAIVTGI